ncbi:MULTISPECIES: hypothetical protein [unclassified Breznakia]|uniref:HAAS signaling domain-containing protein n=1 Tax=unclassified Breznakia TaxID=2623764 RepID=UPI00247465B0|nr:MULTISPECIES: hypothetical protein [unclassified Breznakia]MDH6368128.1 hypothetical protein [Breznakia sp. PH1-1]MDH6405217.1 hypothetical protein [Breznakia sp. PF1-11]MDH6412930.1 hypothetical protein [Breznakia sp. PFB1-11]MDH6415292.1 hypothetical protein [Breznakia sp. PFB1-14]MDH6417602.1 hypothetical protein [Breznakia sp. PFB1-4]
MNKKKNNRIERYVYDVVRRLPESEREDVRKELEANIYDMLADDASDENIKEVLYSMGNPAKLAEEYRQKPKYLISPAIYEDYIHVMKIVIPVVAIALAIIGAIQGVFQVLAVDQQTLSAALVFKKVIGHAIGLSTSAVVQALVWTTVGFVIYERTSLKKGEVDWSVDDLPEVPQEKTKSIPLADIIAELIIGVIFIVAVILIFGNYLPFKVAIYEDGLLQTEIFAKSFVSVLVPMLVIMMAISMVESIVKLIYRHWNIKVCIVSIISHVVGLFSWLYILGQPKIFSNTFFSYVAKHDIDLNAFMRVGNRGFENSIILVFTTIAIIGACAGIAIAIGKTYMYYRTKNKQIA